MIFANKQDLPGALSPDELSRRWFPSAGGSAPSIFGGSGMTRAGLDTVIHYVVSRAKSYKQYQMEHQMAGGNNEPGGGRYR